MKAFREFNLYLSLFAFSFYEILKSIYTDYKTCFNKMYG